MTLFLDLMSSSCSGSTCWPLVTLAIQLATHFPCLNEGHFLSSFVQPLPLSLSFLPLLLSLSLCLKSRLFVFVPFLFSPPLS